MTTTTATPVRARAAARLQQEHDKHVEERQQAQAAQAAYLIGTLANVLRGDLGIEPNAIELQADGCAMTVVDGVQFHLTGSLRRGTWTLLVADDLWLPDTPAVELYSRDSRFRRMDPWLLLGKVLASEEVE